MIAVIFGCLLVINGLLALALQRFYSSVPARELKRLAARGDYLAAALWRPVAFGASLRLLLWIVFGLSMAGGYLLLVDNLNGWAAFGAVAASMAVVVWLLSIRLSAHSVRLAAWLAPALHAVMRYVHPPLNLVARGVSRFRVHAPHSGLYEKEDLIALLKQQKEQPDNRIAPADLELIERAAQLDNLKAADIVLPWSKVKHVKADEHIGPVLLGELHGSGQNSFVVYEGKPDNVVGTLLLHDAVQAKTGGTVRSLMHANARYVHEDFSLRQVLNAFAASGHFMVVVVNAFEEAVGVITLQHILSQLLGEAQAEDIPYEDRASVAAWRPQPQFAEEPIVDETPPAPSSEQTEVVE
jgi:CBS domain containing-hemolysin-like protein